ncbi:MAG: peroxidase family protein, partial [Cyclobacteriaceae bacterium]
GGHTFGKAHGAADPAKYVGREPAGAGIEEQSLGWKNTFGSGKGDDTIGSGLEGAWTPHPTRWDNEYFSVLLGYDWELTKSPAGAKQWTPAAASKAKQAPRAGDASKTQALMMTTADMALKMDPIYATISKAFHKNPKKFADAFAKAWFKLTHRDMGPIALYLGDEVPAKELIWQDPIPAATGKPMNEKDIAALKKKILASGLSVSELVSTAWASASTFRGSDKRGGANGARIRLEPQKSWKANNPDQLAKVLKALTKIQKGFSKKVSLADLIVLGGCAGIEQAAKNAGKAIKVPFTPGRTDATQKQTDVESFAALEPAADGFRNYYAPKHKASAEEMLVDKAQLLTLTVPEMTVLVGGMRVLNTNFDHSPHGVFTSSPEALTNDFFVNLLDMSTTWAATSDAQNVFEGRDRKTGTVRWTGTRADLIFGSNTELRAMAEVYACADSKDKFVKDFVSAWDKVMNLDRFDLK